MNEKCYYISIPCFVEKKEGSISYARPFVLESIRTQTFENNTDIIGLGLYVPEGLILHTRLKNNKIWLLVSRHHMPEGEIDEFISEKEFFDY